MLAHVDVLFSCFSRFAAGKTDQVPDRRRVGARNVLLAAVARLFVQTAYTSAILSFLCLILVDIHETPRRNIKYLTAGGRRRHTIRNAPICNRHQGHRPAAQSLSLLGPAAPCRTEQVQSAWANPVHAPRTIMQKTRSRGRGGSLHYCRTRRPRRA